MKKLVVAFVIFANAPKNETNSMKYDICTAGHVYLLLLLLYGEDEALKHVANLMIYFEILSS
jgi:hypothetical protein